MKVLYLVAVLTLLSSLNAVPHPCDGNHEHTNKPEKNPGRNGNRRQNRAKNNMATQNSGVNATMTESLVDAAPPATTNDSGNNRGNKKENGRRQQNDRNTSPNGGNDNVPTTQNNGVNTTVTEPAVDSSVSNGGNDNVPIVDTQNNGVNATVTEPAVDGATTAPIADGKVTDSPTNATSTVQGADVQAPPSTECVITGKTSHESCDPKYGHPFTYEEVIAIGQAMKLNVDAEYFLKKLEEYGSFCQMKAGNKSLNRKNIGVSIVMMTVMKLKMMPAAKFEGCDDEIHMSNPKSCVQTAGKVYGALKVAGVKKDGKEIESILKENGGDTFGLSADMLVKLWGANEHLGFHKNLCHPDAHKDPPPPMTKADNVFHAVHITSLSDNIDKNKKYANYKDKVPLTLGGFSNIGNWFERGWFTSALAYPELFSEAFN